MLIDLVQQYGSVTEIFEDLERGNRTCTRSIGVPLCITMKFVLDIARPTEQFGLSLRTEQGSKGPRVQWGRPPWRYTRHIRLDRHDSQSNCNAHPFKSSSSAAAVIYATSRSRPRAMSFFSCCCGTCTSSARPRECWCLNLSSTSEE